MIDTQSHISQERHQYQCQFCKCWKDKNDWGPGRIWCPMCRRRQMSPAEIVEGQYRSEHFNEII